MAVKLSRVPLFPYRRYHRIQTQIRRNILIQLRKLGKEIRRHCPSINIPDPGLEQGRKLVLSRFRVSQVRVSKVVRPEDLEVVLEEVPEEVGAVLMLGEYEAFADGRPEQT